MHSINRSARAELAAATLVLVLTGILVSIPAPKAPGDRPGNATPPAANGPAQPNPAP